MSSIRKALQNRWLYTRFAGNEIEGKENHGYVETPTKAITSRTRSNSNVNNHTLKTSNRSRNSCVTKSLKDSVGTLRQKLKKSVRQRKHLQNQVLSKFGSFYKKMKRAVTRTSTRKGHREFQVLSPCAIDTPRLSNDSCAIRTRSNWHDVETPTCLRKEVEDLTANMKILVALTPRTLRSRAFSRRHVFI